MPLKYLIKTTPTRIFLYSKFAFYIFLFKASQLFAQQTDLNISDNLNALNLDNINVENNPIFNSYQFLELERYQNNPIDINTIDKEEIKKIYFLTEQQKNDFLNYKKTYGSFIDLDELQKIKSWDKTLIEAFKKIVTLNETLNYSQQKLAQKIIIQNTNYLNPSQYYKLNDSNKNKFLGTPADVFIKYLSSYKNISWGLVAKQNAGEAYTKYGADFYTLFYSQNFTKNKFLKQIFIGDFIVHWGQGLTEWQRFSFSKTNEVLKIKKDYPSFSNHQSLTEYNFKRGVAIITEFKKIILNTFISYINIDANVDSNNRVTTLLKTGYHRNMNELNDKNNLAELSLGVEIKYVSDNLNIGLRNIFYNYNKTWQSNSLFSPTYKYPFSNFYVSSIDYDYHYKSLNLFGELAKNKFNQYAFLQGLIGSLNERLDYAVLLRHFDIYYYSIYDNPFMESSSGANENALYIGLLYNINKKINIQYYVDIVNKPFLSFNSLSSTKIGEHLFKIHILPNHDFDITLLTQFKNKYLNNYITINNKSVLNTKEILNRYRVSIKYTASQIFQFNTQIDYSQFNNSFVGTQGFSYNVDFIFNKIYTDKIKTNVRLQLFEVDNDNTAIYTFERDVLHDFTFNYLNGKGFRYYINISYHPWKALHLSCKWSQSIYENVDKLSSGYNEIDGNKRTTLKVQAIYSF